MAEPGAGARALDQAGDVGDDELAVVGLERAEHRLERRERIRRDLRLRAREAGEQRRLAGVREPDEPDVGEQLEVQLDRALLARQAALGQPRRLAHGRLEARVAAAAGAAARDRHLLAGAHEVVARAVPALDLRAGRHRDHERLAVGAVALGALAVAAALGAEVRAAAEALQVAQVVVAAQHDVAAAAAVAAVGAALGHVRLAPEGQAAVAAARRRGPRCVRGRAACAMTIEQRVPAGNGRERHARRQGLPHHRRVDRHRRRDRPPRRRGRLPAGARRALGGQAARPGRASSAATSARSPCAAT